MAEVGDVLWAFVHLAAELPYSDLCETAEYDAMCDAVHSTDADCCGRLALSLAYGLDEDSPPPSLHVAPPGPGTLLPRGVSWDARRFRYEFVDVNALFSALPELLAPSCPADAREALRRCRTRIASTLRVMEAAEELGTISMGRG